MGKNIARIKRGSIRYLVLGGILALSVAIGGAFRGRLFAAQASSQCHHSRSFHRCSRTSEDHFPQDSTQTEEKYYLETMGTGVAWIDYDQDGLMDLILRAVGRHRFLQAAASAALALFITTMATELSPTSPKKPASAARDITARAWPSAISTTMAIPTC